MFDKCNSSFVGARFADPAPYESRSNLYYGQMPGKTGTLSNPNIPDGIEPTDFTLTAVLKRPKATVKQQEHMKQVLFSLTNLE